MMPKRTLTLFALILLFMLSLSACGCTHKTWMEANCLNPKTCADCGETEGETLGHNWQDATCQTPKTCAVCDETEGAALGHEWMDATTEAPKTCAECGTTEGERIMIYGTWVTEIVSTPDPTQPFGFPFPVVKQFTLTLTDSWEIELSLSLTNAEELYAALVAREMDKIYDDYESKEAAERDFMDDYGQTVQEIAELFVSMYHFYFGLFDSKDLFDFPSLRADYSTRDGSLNTNILEEDNWVAWPYSLDGNALTIYGDFLKAGEETYVFTRVTES